MALDGYHLNTSGYPSCQINRGDFLDPYYGSGSQSFGISSEVEAVQRGYVPAGIEVEASWADESQQHINVTTTTTFVDNVAGANYRIGYVLTQDGVPVQLLCRQLNQRPEPRQSDVRPVEDYQCRLQLCSRSRL